MSGWRAQAEPGVVRPASVGAVVRAVRSSLRATHAVESVLLGVAGGLLACCALLLSDAPAGAGARFVALLCGALAALTWWLEHAVELAPTARVLDQRLRHHGALVTAFELELGRAAPLSSQPSSPLHSPLNSMEELVRERVLARLRTREAVRAVFPPLLLPIGAPTLAALCLVLLADARRAVAPAPVDYGALADGLERALSLGGLDAEAAGLEGAHEDGGLSRAQLQELNQVLQARATLPFAPEEWTRAPEAVQARVEELDRRFAELAAEVAPGSELHARLEEARTWLDALRMGLATTARSAADESAQGSMPGSATEAPADGTISGSPAAPGTPPMATAPTAPPALPNLPPAAPGNAEALLGRQAGSWWPGEYDAVVEGWIERSRAAGAGER